VKKRSLMSAWRRSISSTRKTEHRNPAYNLPGEAATAAEAAEAAEAATEAAEAAAAEVAVAASGFGGEVAEAAAVEAAGGGDSDGAIE